MKARPSPRNGPRKTIKRVIVFMLLGAIVTFAVAWGAAIRKRPASHIVPRSRPVQVIDGNSLFSVHKRFGEVIVSAMRFGSHPAARFAIALVEPAEFKRALPRFSRFHDQPWVLAQLDEAMKVGSKAWVYEYSHGWPMLAMTGRMTEADLGPHSPSATQYHGLIRMRDLTTVLPLRVYAPGFIINTIFYAGILWMMFGLPAALRRRRRIKRGLCTACGYPIGTSEVCTECGQRVVNQKAQTQEAEIA